jgi:hypothetical protein
MAYTKITNFTAKDTLLTGNPAKLVKGVDIDAEFNAIASAYSNVDNTSDANKPVSSATTTALNLKANLTSPSFITPTLGTPVSGNFSTGTFTWPTFNQNTSGTAANLSGTPTLPSGTTLVAPALGTPGSGNLENCTFPTLNQDTTGYASALKSATTTVSVSAATAPSNGQVLTATSGTAATWQTPTSGGGSGTVTSVAAITLGTTGTDLSSSVANSTTTPVITLNVPTASAANRGALSAADWTTFNSKQASGSYLTSGGALGTPTSGNFSTGTFTWPTFNQSTSGTAANLSGTPTLPSGTTLVAPVLGTPASGNLSNCTVDGTNAIGYKGQPQNAQANNYTLVLTDAGKHIYETSGSNSAVNIPANASVAFPIGTRITLVNVGATALGITASGGASIIFPGGLTGIIATTGVCDILKIGTDSWIGWGAGVT